MEDQKSITYLNTWGLPCTPINLSSTNRGFRTINHMVATYEQTKKGLSYFYPTRQVQDDGIQAKPLNF